MEKIIDLDKKLFVLLNGLGSEPFDNFWLIITKQLYWSPLFLAVFYLLWRKIGWKGLGIIILTLAIMITFTDQTCNFFKNYFQRLRPCNDTEINEIIRIVKTSPSFSFFSGHATNSMASTVLVVSIMRKYYRFTFLLFLFPLIFAYSRIYLGLHFPTDILTGYIFGIIAGTLCYKALQFLSKKYNWNVI